MLQGKVKEEVELSLREPSRQMGCEVVGLDVPVDPGHALVQIPPKISIAAFMGRVKGKGALRGVSVWRELRRKPYWGNPFWAKGWWVDPVGLEPERIRQYVKWQEEQEQKQAELRLSQ